MNTANRDVLAQRDLLQNEIWTVPTRHCLTLPSRTTYFPPHMSVVFLDCGPLLTSVLSLLDLRPGSLLERRTFGFPPTNVRMYALSIGRYSGWAMKVLLGVRTSHRLANHFVS